MNRIVLTLILCLGLAGCIPAAPPQANPVEQGPINDNGSTQFAGIHNHGTLNVFVNSPGPDNVPGPIEKSAPIAPAKKKTIKSDEGLRLKPYADTGDKLHIGYGRNLTDKGITKDEAEILFENDMAEVRVDLSQNIFAEEWPSLPGEIRFVLANMRYQLGPEGFRRFGCMISAVRAREWPWMALEMIDSKWAEQTPERADRLIKIVESMTTEEEG